MFFIDTNVLILGLAGQESEASVLKKLILEEELLFSPIVIAEFLSKALKKDQKLLDKLLIHFRVCPMGEKTARIAVSYRQQFSRKTKPPFLIDCFLAALCKENSCGLITNNIKDFPMKDIEILTPKQFLQK